MKTRIFLRTLVLTVCYLVGPAKALANTAQLPLLFWDAEDITNGFGKLEFGAEPLSPGGQATGYPNMQYGCEVPRPDGRVWIYGWRLASGAIEIVRCATADGLTFEDTATVFSYANPNWQGFANIVCRPSDGTLFLFTWSAGHLYVLRSNNGNTWNLLTSNAYVDHDAMCVMWHPPFNKFINYQNTLQPWPKRYPDNIGSYRRVMSFRRSADGVSWESFSPDFLMGAPLWTPDAADPVDLEFYRSVVFPHQGRFAMILLDYIAPPPEANSRRATTKHGPRGRAEWAISRDGLNWKRPYRETDPIGDLCWLALQGPLTRNGVLRFYLPGGTVATMPDDRIFYVTCRGNGEFSTQLFTMPTNGLCLNADVRYLPCEGTTGRAYVMAELRGEDGQVIPGFERTKCILENVDGRTLALVWDGNYGRALAGRNVRIRFYLHEAKIYGAYKR